MFFLIPIINTLFFPKKSSIIYTNESFRSKIRRYVIEEEKDEEKMKPLLHFFILRYLQIERIQHQINLDQ